MFFTRVADGSVGIHDDGSFLYFQVKKAVGGSIRGMAFYEDDVRPAHVWNFKRVSVKNDL